MFDGFTREFITTSGTEIHLVRGGEGPPLLLLHGFPQTHVAWHKLAGPLAQHCTVVVADLRGYGDSGAPDPGRSTLPGPRWADDVMAVALDCGHFLMEEAPDERAAALLDFFGMRYGG